MATGIQIQDLAEATVPITGPRLTPPPGPIFHLCRAADSDYELGEFRAWAGYKNLGSDGATGGLAHFQHVLSFAGTEAAGRTGVHAHFAHVHIVIPTSGRGVFSYDGVVTEALPGGVIVQHGGTVHDQFEYSYAASSQAENRKTPRFIEPPPAGTPPCSFGFLELFVPRDFANVEIIPPDAVSAVDQRTAWDHPYHAEGASFCLQAPDAPDAAYRPLAGRPDLEVRDAGTWGPSGCMVATWIIRPAAGPSEAAPVSAEIAGEEGGIDILYMINGSASFPREGGETVRLEAGDTLTQSHGICGDPIGCSPDMRLIRFFISARAQDLRRRTPEEIKALEALGPRIITRREVRPEGDARPINALRET
ncbi:MAG: hypothetical protein P4L64_11800 [Caulobacteraceae bacterium]|nr:hypothetical protein [Caulobacteraceae bacterium]